MMFETLIKAIRILDDALLGINIATLFSNLLVYYLELFRPIIFRFVHRSLKNCGQNPKTMINMFTQYTTQ